MTKTYTVQTPGKLYVSGEYAILYPGQVALIKNIPIYMTGRIRLNDTFELSSDMFDYTVGREKDDNYALIQETIDFFEAYLGKPLLPFQLEISGKLEKNGKKFGIGSSGSVVILILKALASFYKINLDKDKLFKLACLVLLSRGDNGSMGDLACIAYDDFVCYKSFDRTLIKSRLTQESLTDILESDWGYAIDLVKVSLPTTFMVGWTQEPAISKNLVNEVKSAITDSFLKASYELSLALKNAFETVNKTQAVESFSKLNHLLSELHPAIMTNRLEKLVSLSQSLGAVAKSSGAGGGDCGIALTFDKVIEEELEKVWQEQGIELLYREEWGKHES